MALEYRNPSEDELRATLEAANVAFANELRDDDFELQKRELPPYRVVGAFDDGKPIGLTASIAFEMTVPGGVALVGQLFAGTLGGRMAGGSMRNSSVGRPATRDQGQAEHRDAGENHHLSGALARGE